MENHSKGRTLKIKSEESEAGVIKSFLQNVCGGKCSDNKDQKSKNKTADTKLKRSKSIEDNKAAGVKRPKSKPTENMCKAVVTDILQSADDVRRSINLKTGKLTKEVDAENIKGLEQNQGEAQLKLKPVEEFWNLDKRRTKTVPEKSSKAKRRSDGDVSSFYVGKLSNVVFTDSYDSGSDDNI